MKYLFIIVSIFILPLFVVNEEKAKMLEDGIPVSQVLKDLGDESITHQVNPSLKGVSAEVGKNLFTKGFAKSSKIQSKHFVCTSCHNVEKEDPDLSVSDPQARLLYAKENGLPILQGTTMYGAVDRTSFYNGDYYKKYGDLVKDARHDIRGAIQLCAVECAQGRALKDWELESILAYLWTLELKMSDLHLTPTEHETISKAINEDGDKKAALELVKSKYLQGSPATFVAPPDNRKKGAANVKGDPKNGKLVYDLSCKHCHENERYSFYSLDDSKVTFEHLDKHFPRYNRYSTYQVTRWGTPPLPGKGAYMPQYPLEKLSVQQLEDLKAYVAEQAR